MAKSIYAPNPDWYTIEHGIRAKAGRHVVDADLYLPRKRGKRADHLVCTVSGYTGIKDLYPRLFAEALTRKGYTVLAVELLGYGASSGSASEILLSEQADALHAVAREIKRRKQWASCTALGWGMGAGICFTTAGNKPRLFGGLVGVNGLYISELVQRGVRGDAAYEHFCQTLQTLRKVQADTGEPIFVRAFMPYPLDPDTEHVVDNVLRYVTGYDAPPVHLAFADQLLQLDARTSLKQIQSRPTLLIHGQRNPIHPAEHVRAFLEAYPAKHTPQTVWLPAKHNDFMSFEHKVFGQMINRIDDWLKQTFVDGQARGMAG